MRRFAVLIGLLLCSIPLFAATRGGPIPVPLPLFPPNNWWNLDVSAAPLDEDSDDYIDFIGQNKIVHPDFGGDAGDGDVYGIPYIIVDASQPKKTVDFVLYPGQSDGVGVPFYPVPDEAITMNGWVEGGQPGNVDQRDDADRHILIVDSTNNHLYELYNCWWNGTNWEAGSGAFFDMNTNNRRTEGWTSADASGMAMLPGLVRRDEVFGPDEIRHAFRFTVRATNGYVYPASHVAGSTTNAPPMGTRLRLKADKNISSYPPEIQKIFRAFKKYGLILADNGTDMYVSGMYDPEWDNDVLNPAFHSLKASDFEVVQLGWNPSITLVVSMSDVAGNGDPMHVTVTAYDTNYNVATGYTGTVQFTSTDGASTLPMNYTFTGADAGTHLFPFGITLRTPGSQIVTVTDVANATFTGSKGVRVGPPTPIGFMATAITTTRIDLAWNPSAGATLYEIIRRSASGVVSLGTTPLSSFSDTTVTPNGAYVYQVRAMDASSRISPFSIPEVASTRFFTDPALVVNTTSCKRLHVEELRAAADALRATAGLGAMTYTDPSLTGVAVKAVHLQELRTALQQARAALSLDALVFTDPTLTGGTTRVKAAHFQELRGGVQ